MQEELDNLGRQHTVEDNLQTILNNFKQDIQHKAITLQRKMIPTITRDIQVTKDALIHALNEHEGETNPEGSQQKQEITRLTEQLDNLEKKPHQQIQMGIETKNRLEGETICKGWCTPGKEK